MPSLKQRTRRSADRELQSIRKTYDTLAKRGITSTAELSFRVASVDEATRSVSAIIATDRPVLVPDWQRGELVDEVLIIGGMRSAGAVPLLENHMRFAMDDQIGGVDSVSTDLAAGTVSARLRFLDFGTEDDYGRRQERMWLRVREGVSRSVSAGYRVNDATYIRAGESTEVNGKRYTAGKRTMKVVTSWDLYEVSLVPVGADPAAMIRAFHGGEQMPQTEQSPAEETRGQQPAAPANVVTQPAAPLVGREAVPAEKIVSIDEALRAERARVAAIEARAKDFAEHDEIRSQAISEGWSDERFAAALLDAVRAKRSAPVGRQAPAIHSTSHEQRCNVDALSLAVAQRLGVAVDSRSIERCKESPELSGVFRKPAESDERKRAMDAAWEYRSMSLVDIAREAVRLSGRPVTHDRTELLKRAFSTAEFGDIFSNSISAAVLVGYVEAADSTVAWTSEAEVPNFLTNERHLMGKFGQLKQLKTGGTADDVDSDSVKETYKVKRYAGKFTLDEQDIINDSLGAMDQIAPMDMGAAARQLRPDLVYSILLANANLVDSVALFEASSHKNLLTSSALSTATLGTMMQTFLKQRIEGRPLSLRQRFLIVPADLYITALNVAQSPQRADATSGAGSDNVISQFGIQVIADDRLGAVGVTNPDGGAALTGSATSWYGACRPGENGAKTIEVGFIRGMGRMPRLRSYALSQGQYGLGWDISMDIGAKALDYRAMCKANA